MAIPEREDVSQAHVIRRAIRQYVAEQRRSRDFALGCSGSGPGGSIADVTLEVPGEGVNAMKASFVSPSATKAAFIALPP